MHSFTASGTGVLKHTHNRWDLYFFFMIGILCLGRIVFIALAPLDLAPDEAYYWDWSRVLDWGYYSKPPMIAWINALSTGVLGVSAFAVRLPSALMGSVSLIFLYLLARRLFDSKTAFMAAAATAASPGNCALNFIMTIDAPLICFWSVALYTFQRAQEKTSGEISWWILTGIMVGLGTLSKQMMLVFPLLIILFALLTPGHRVTLGKLGPIMALFIALALIFPDVYWNIKHQWITFYHTTHHFEGHHHTGLYFLRTFSDFIGSQAGLITPITWFLLVMASACAFLGFRRQTITVRYLLIFGPFVLLFFILMSFRQRIQGNWPAVFYASGTIVLACWYTGVFSCGRKLDRLRRLFIPGLLLGALLALLTYALPFILPLTNLGGSDLDPTGRLRGWQLLGMEVDKSVSALPRPQKTFVITSQRQLTSELAFYMKGNPRVYLWNGKNSPLRSQYDLWPGFEQRKSQDSLMVFEKGHEPDPDLASLFLSVRYLGRIQVPKGKGGSRVVELYFGERLSP